MDARNQILRAFGTLVFSTPYDDITVERLVSEAGVARSKFYVHFSGKQALLLEAVRPLLDIVRDVVDGVASEARIREMLDHVWTHRGVGHRFLDPSFRHRLAFAAQTRDRADPLIALRTHGVLGLLYDWISGQIAADVDDLILLLQTEFGAERAAQSPQRAL